MPQVVQHISCHGQRVGGGVVEHRVSAAPSCLGDVRREVVEPVGQVGIGEEPRPARAETSATLHHDHQLIGDPSTVVVQFLRKCLSGPVLPADAWFRHADDMALHAQALTRHQQEVHTLVQHIKDQGALLWSFNPPPKTQTCLNPCRSVDWVWSRWRETRGRRWTPACPLDRMWSLSKKGLNSASTSSGGSGVLTLTG